MNTKGELTGCIQNPTPNREAGLQQPEPEGMGQSRPQRLASSIRLWAGPQLLTTSSWDPGQLTSARRVAAWDQLPRGHTWHTWVSTLVVHPGNRVAGTGEVIKMRGHLGQCTHQASGHLNCSNLGSTQNARPTESPPLRITWEPERERLRPEKGTKCRVRFGEGPCSATWSLSSVDMESARHRELGQTQSGPYTVSTSHTCRWYLLAVSLPPHNTTEKVSLISEHLHPFVSGKN